MNTQVLSVEEQQPDKVISMNMFSRLWILMRREMWENRIGFVWAPLVVSAVIIVIGFMTMFMVHQFDSQNITTSDAIRLFATEVPAEEKQHYVGASLLSLQVLFSGVLFFITVFYLLGALYDDRKDRSILFWKSLPVSDSMTVISKLASGSLLLPAIFLIAVMITQLCVLFFATGYALVAGIDPWSNLWVPAQLLSSWGIYILGSLIQALWLLPLWGWLLFCSSFAPRLPLLFAIGIPLLVGWIHKYLMFIQNFDYKSPTILYYIAERITSAVLPLSVRATIGNETVIIGLGESDGDEADAFNHSLTLSYLGERLLEPAMWYGIIVGALFIAASIYFRRRASDQ